MMVFALLATAAFALQAALPDSAELASPFAGFETHRLSNGLKVWYKHLPGDPVVSISVATPFGSDRDPVGKEQLAHFTEHMLFSDQPGLSEEEIKREIEARGGVYNASVTPDRSFYYVRIGREHARFALEWLHRILAPHAMAAEVVDRQRQPVALEVRARPRQFFDWLLAYYINPPSLRTPGFWEREFGIETWSSRDYYPYSSLNNISSADLRWFYDTYYVPSLLTLTVIGDVERGPMLDAIRETFATLPVRPEPEPANALRDPRRYRQTVYWAYRSNVYYANRFKFYEVTADQEITLIFLSRLLSKRLNDRLRFSERKVAYGISVGVAKRGGAAYLYITGGLKPEEIEFARGVIEDELDALRSGTLPPDQFDEDRAALTRQLKVANASPEDLEGWVRNFFYDPRVHADFPDLASTFESMTLDEVEHFAREHLVRERQVLTIIYPHPITQGLLLVFVAVLLWLSVSAARRGFLRPVDMSRIRYIARFKLPRLYSLAALAALLALIAVGGRLLAYLFQVLADRWLVTLDSFLVQWIAYAGMLVTLVLFLFLVLAHVPRKVLLFDDHAMIKYLSFRSWKIPLAQLEEVSLRSFPAVWLSRRLWRCVPLTLGVLTPGIYLRQRGGRAYFFNVRDRDEFLRVLAAAAATSADPPLGRG